MSSPDADVFDALKPGETLLEYRIEKVLGHGGFGITYLARDTLLNADFAIKEFLPPELAARAAGQSVTVRSADSRDAFAWAKQKFLNEAQVLARFSHPSLVRVSRFFEANGTVYFVMEFVAGQTLEERLRQGPIEQAGPLEALLLPLVEGMAQVHEAGVLHRDIKPGNIILRADAGPVLIDFGAARHAFGSVTKSMLNVVTAGYAPIEQYSDGMEQGPWTDIYALGAVAYRAISGSKPSDAINRLRKDPLVPALQLGGERFPQAMLQAIDWALRVHPEDRPQSLDHWRAALLGEQPVPPAPARSDSGLIPGIGSSAAGETDDTTALRPFAAGATAGDRAEPLLGGWLRPFLIASALILLLSGAWILRPLDHVADPAPAAQAATPGPAATPGRRSVDDVETRVAQGEAVLAANQTALLAEQLAHWLELDPADPAALLLRGHLAFSEKRRADGVADYAQALAQRPGLASNPQLAANLVGALGWVTGPAEALILRHANPSIHQQLAQRAVQAGPVGRGHAVRLLEELGQADLLDPLLFARVELTDRDACDARIAAIETIGRLGDASWIPLLKAQIPGWLSNLCLRGPIRRAVEQLEQRPVDQIETGRG